MARTPRAQLARYYRAALLDDLLGNTERAHARANLLGRRAVDAGLDLLQIVRIHQEAVVTILASTPMVADAVRALESSHDFLLEVLGVFEMTHRGYIDLIKTGR